MLQIVQKQRIEVDHDAQITIAIAKSRFSQHLTNEQVTWSEFINRLQNTKQINQTIDEYSKLTKDKQDDLKDVGGFIGGALVADGNKTLDNIKSRAMLTFDCDNLPVANEIWADYQSLYGNAAVMYSTIKHKPSAPRFRLCVLLNRSVTTDEYVAIARKVASDLGIDYFDPRSFVPAQIMYWSTTLKSADRIFEYIDYEPLDVDAVLATYDDWTDHSEYKYSAQETNVQYSDAKPRHGSNKQQDPRSKDALIGEFCRTYNIHQAIDAFLPDIYIRSDRDKTRYTYYNSTTSNGVVTYDDLFLYSNHASDPLNMQLLNAFDLVMQARFGYLDVGTHLSVPKNKRPSFFAMLELIQNDKHVMAHEFQHQIVEREQEIRSDDPLITRLARNEKGKLLNTIDNIVMILNHDDMYKGKIRQNLFTQRPMIGTKNMSDTDEAKIRHYIELRYGINHRKNITDAITIVLDENRFHPVIDYINGIVWDGVPRVNTLFIDLLGAENTEYVQTVTRKTLIGAIDRVMNPGCKFDTMLILTGAQGIGKSSIFECLAGEWFSDSLESFSGKDSYELIQGKWINEIGELNAMSKNENKEVKLFLSKSVDTFRASYGRLPNDYPRQCIFVGTTNEDEFLFDETGNRRTWAIEVKGNKDIRNIVTKEFAAQIWAEAFHFFQLGEPSRLTTDEQKLMQVKEQKRYTFVDPMVGMLESFLKKPITHHWYSLPIYQRRAHFDVTFGQEVIGTKTVRTQISAIEIANEMLGVDRFNYAKNRSLQNQINKAMKQIYGWKKSEIYFDAGHEYGRQRPFVNEEFSFLD
jgi:predicted P-loop ATPase